MIVVGEHHKKDEPFIHDDIEHLSLDKYVKYFVGQRSRDELCFELKRKDKEHDFHLETYYYIGVDWVHKNQLAIQVQPKFNKNKEQDGEYVEIDFKAMLAEALSSKKASESLKHLYKIKWHDPLIELDQDKDLLTPFLVMEYLNLLKIIVRKGLRKGYYKVHQNLHARVKGKVLVSQTIKHNHSKGNYLNTHCAYEEFGFNTPENRLLKKALDFVKAYLPKYFNRKFDEKDIFQNTFNYIGGAFGQVSSQIELTEIKSVIKNPFFKEYSRATDLAKLILKRYGYKESNVSKTKIKTPPYWINMAMLFELFVLSKLEKSFGNQVDFQFSDKNNYLDFLLNFGYSDVEETQFVADAKYKRLYQDKDVFDSKDVRQVSGYARMNKVLDALKDGMRDRLIPCIIFYPDEKEGYERIDDETLLKREKSSQYSKMYKLGIRIPTI